jgi:hypothetical protein
MGRRWFRCFGIRGSIRYEDNTGAGVAQSKAGKPTLDLFFFFIPQLDPHAAERKLSPEARTEQAQSLRQVRWRVTGNPAPPLPAFFLFPQLRQTLRRLAKLESEVSSFHKLNEEENTTK